MEIRISKEGDRVALKSGWRPSIAEECKSVPQASWSKVEKRWSYPLSMSTLRSLREVFGDELVVQPALWEWAKAEAKREKELTTLQKSTDATITEVFKHAPTLAVAMGDRTYQRVAARFGATAGNYCLADEPGLGKTATSLAAIMESGNWRGDILIAAPKTSLSGVWGRQIKMWAPLATVHVMPDAARAKREAEWAAFQAAVPAPNQPRILVVNPAMLRRQYQHYCKKCDVWQEDVESRTNKTIAPVEHHTEDHGYKRMVRKEEWPELLNHQWQAFILDESHQVLASYTPARLKSQQMVQGILDIKAEQISLLTGTPLRGSELNLWGSLNVLDRKRFGSYWAFAGEYFEVVDNGFGKTIGPLRHDRRDEFYRIVDRYVLRRTRAEVRSDLPLGQRLDLSVPLEGKHRKQYEEFATMGEVALEEGSVSGMGTLSELTRLRQMAWGTWNDPHRNGKLVPTTASPKWESILAWLAERGVTGKKTTDFMPEQGNGFKYVIASQFTEIVDLMERELNAMGVKTLKITGAVSGKRRTAAQELFQSNDAEHRVMLIQTITGGVAIELDAWADEMLIVDETFVADDQVQLEGRINNRSGRVASRSWWYLRTLDTIDQAMAESNYSQHDVQHKLLDGRRGVELALHLIRGGK
jgi:SNF2 family DNA or RNA helicase